MDVAVLTTTGLGFLGVGLSIARMWGRFEARFDAQDLAIGELKTTLNKSMERIGAAEIGLGIVMDRTRSRTGGEGVG